LKKKRKRQKYDVSSRVKKTQELHAKIIETFVALLADKRGADVKIEEVAERSGISERTIYRLFNDKEHLGTATEQYMQNYLLASAQDVGLMELPAYAQHLFVKFDKHENLVLAYLYSKFGIEYRTHFRQKFNQILIAKILHDKKLTMTKARERKLAVIVSLINAKIWHDMRTDFGLKGADAGEAIAEAVALLLQAL
jgi:AcrR family transcriptional regulator